MIEFAPNPSGPSHIGTLRTYAVAYLLAQQKQEPLFVRFDAWDQWDWYSPTWADSFLQELSELKMFPDAWQYCDLPPYLTCLPSWAVVEHQQPNNARFPEVIDAVIPDPRPLHWKLEAPMPHMTVRAQESCASGNQEAYTSFAVWDEIKVQYRILGYVASLINMNLRSTSTIVRSHHIAYVRSLCETFASKWFNFHLPEVLYAAVVVGSDGGLKKSKHIPGQINTVRWAIDKFGCEKVRSSVLYSARNDDRPIIGVSEILSDL